MKLRSSLIIAILIASALGSQTRPQQLQDAAQLRGVVQEFLGVWVIKGDPEAMANYFGSMTNRTDIMPRAVQVAAGPVDGRLAALQTARSAYARFLRGYRPANVNITAAATASLQLPSDTFMKGLTLESPPLNNCNEDRFCIFHADEDLMDEFSGGFGDLSGVLEPRKIPMYAVMVQFRRPQPGPDRPLITFWDKRDNNTWKIQALGALSN